MTSRSRSHSGSSGGRSGTPSGGRPRRPRPSHYSSGYPPASPAAGGHGAFSLRSSASCPSQPSRSPRSSSPFPAHWRWRISSQPPPHGQRRARGPPPSSGPHKKGRAHGTAWTCTRATHPHQAESGAGQPCNDGSSRTQIICYARDHDAAFKRPHPGQIGGDVRVTFDLLSLSVMSSVDSACRNWLRAAGPGLWCLAPGGWPIPARCIAR